MIEIVENPGRVDWDSLLARPVMAQGDLTSLVAEVFSAVQKEGDSAVMQLTARFDQVQLENLKVGVAEYEAAESLVSDELKASIQVAYDNIVRFHSTQIDAVQVVATMPGVECWRKSVGIESVGLYVPGGTAPLFSTVLMLAIPARLAACNNVVLCTPPGSDGNIHPAILYAAKLCGINQVFKIGGIQAIAAMTIGTELVPAVNKLFGPGNQFVTAAKQYAQQFGVAIDMPAGPSEVLVYADQTGSPDFIAADLLAQAEHGADSQVVFISTDLKLLESTRAVLYSQLAQLPRKDVAKEAINNSVFVFVSDEKTAVNMINFYAPEHLILVGKNEEQLAGQIINAGSVFIGPYTPESAGDYASGTNHTLPTNGYAKNYSGVSVDSFLKKITFQRISKEGLELLGPHVERMAQAESLEAHKNAVTIRLKK